MIDDGFPLAVLLSDGGKQFREVAISEIADLRENSFIVGVVHPDVAKWVDAAAVHHVRANMLVNAITILVAEAAPPPDDRNGLEVTSFLASGAIASVLRTFRANPRRWCYKLLKYILDQERIACELRIVHKAVCEPVGPVGATCDVILPHRGSETYVRLSTDSLRRQTQNCTVIVTLDQDDDCAAFLADIADESNIQAYQLRPCNIGPDFARHVFSMRSSADFIAFQDSDDISLPQRLSALTSAAEVQAAGIVGSHELQVHEVHEKVYAIRYPLNVNASLERAGANHQLLLPTSVVRADVFERVGGFSTSRSYNDVAFWLTASLSTKIINVDEFLYVRRRHPSSLTMHPDTGTGSSARRAIVARRRADYFAIVAGRLTVRESTLAIRHRKEPVAFKDLKSGIVFSEVLA